MIEKRIYSTWISPNPIPEKYHKYIESWKRIMPDYEIKIISLDTVKLSPFVVRAIKEKNFALAGHYARIQELYDNGGIYFDIDIEATKSLDSLLHNSFVVGIEDRWNVNNAVIISEKGNHFLKHAMEFMDNFDWKTKDIELETGPRMFTKIAKKHYGWDVGKIGKFRDISILPPVYFYPYRYDEKYTPACVKPETFTVHHWSNSWNDRVSIIIPCYNQGKFLKDAIESALNQTHKNIEVVVVNDGSTDNTSEVMRSYGKRIKAVTQTNKGLSAARNAGIKASTGGWILPLDSDDTIEPTYIEKTIGKADIVGTWIKCFGKYKDIWKPAHGLPSHENFLKQNHLFSCTLFKRCVFTNTGGYDEEMFVGGKQGCNGFEDWEYWIRATEDNFSVYIVPECLVNYRIHEVSMYRDADKNRSKILSYMKTKHQMNVAMPR